MFSSDIPFYYRLLSVISPPSLSITDSYLLLPFPKMANYRRWPVNKYVLLDVLLCSITEYFYKLPCFEPSGQVKIQTTSKNYQHTKQQNAL